MKIGDIISGWEVKNITEVRNSEYYLICDVERTEEKKIIKANMFFYNYKGIEYKKKCKIDKWVEHDISNGFESITSGLCKNFSFLPEPILKDIFEDKPILIYYPIFSNAIIFSKTPEFALMNIKKTAYYFVSLLNKNVFLSELNPYMIKNYEQQFYIENIYSIIDLNEYGGFNPSKLNLINKTFSAPEFFETKSEITAQTAVYMLGKLLYFLIDRIEFNQLFFDKFPDKNEYESAINNNGNISAPVKQFLLKCLPLNPKLRFSDCYELINYINNINNVVKTEPKNIYKENKGIQITYTPYVSGKKVNNKEVINLVDNLKINIDNNQNIYTLFNKMPEKNFAKKPIEIGNQRTIDVLNKNFSNIFKSSDILVFVTTSDSKDVEEFLKNILTKIKQLILISPKNYFYQVDKVDYYDITEYMEKIPMKF